MQQSEQARGAPIGPILAIVGGALLAIGSFLPWAEVSGNGVSSSASGIDGSDGFVTVVAGAVAIVTGIVAMRAGRRLLAILAVVAGLVGGGLGVYDALTAEDSVLDTAAEEIAPQFGVTPEQVRTLLDEAIAGGELSVSISIGLYVVIAGGALALVGGAIQMMGRGARAPATPIDSASATAMPPPSAPVREELPAPPRRPDPP
jgi:hypothetical protein